jgi:hypothetical protein
MRRYTPRPYGGSVSGMRLVSMLMAILVLWMLYNRLNDPATWRAFAEGREPVGTQVTAPIPSVPEIIIPGPNDLDQEEVASIKELFELVTDKSPLKSREMDAYWRLMDWSRTQSFSELEKRSIQDIAFTQLWEQPELYRGKPIRLRLHALRVLEYPAPKDQPEFTKVYEAWGGTSESRTLLYSVVFPDLPNGLPVGPEIRAEIDFVGYFLKLMSYKGYDQKTGVPLMATRAAPLLVGRARLISTPGSPPPPKSEPWIIPLAIAGALLMIGLSVWASRSMRKKSKVRMLPDELFSIAAPGNFPNKSPFAGLDTPEQVVKVEMSHKSDLNSASQQSPDQSI